jgi:UDP-arabinose 4-epimerase
VTVPRVPVAGAVLVTGGAGFVGSHAVRALAAAGRRVVVVDDLSTGHREAVRWGTLVEGDAGDEALVRATCRDHGVGAILHFAGRISVEESVRDPRGYRESIVDVTRRLATAAREAGVERLVFSSTAGVYGTPAVVPVGEDAPPAPVSPYGAFKAEAEALLAGSGLAVASLRYFNAAGAAAEDGLGERHDPETHLIPLALRAARDGRSFTVHGDDWPTPDGTCVRDYVHVVDLADAHLAALARLESGCGGGTWNLGTGRGASVREVAAAVERAVGRRLDARVGPRRAGDAAALVADPARAARDLGWRATARSSLDAIVADAWAFETARGAR